MTGTERWSGTIAMEGVMTGDGRHIEPGALTLGRRVAIRAWGDKGDEDGDAYDGITDWEVIGSITSIRREGGAIVGEGEILRGWIARLTAEGRCQPQIEIMPTGHAGFVQLDDHSITVEGARIIGMVLGDRPAWDGLGIAPVAR